MSSVHSAPSQAHPMSIAPSHISVAAIPEIPLETEAFRASSLIRLLRESVKCVFEAIEDGSLTKERISEKLTDVRKHFESLESLTSSSGWLSRHWPNIASANLQKIILDRAEEVQEEEDFVLEILKTYAWGDKLKETANFKATMAMSLTRKNESRLLGRGQPRLALPANPSQLCSSLLSLRQAMGLRELEFPEYKRFQEEMELTGGVARTRSVFLINVTQIYFAEDGNPNSARMVPVMKCAIIFRGILPDWINVKGPEEDFRNSKGQLVVQDRSVHELFRRLSDYLKGQIMSLTAAANYPQKVLQILLIGLHRYRFLLAEPCRNCKRFLKNNTPPYCLEGQFPGRMPGTGFCHDSCRNV